MSFEFQTIEILNIYFSCLLNFSQIPQKRKWPILSLVFILLLTKALNAVNSLTYKKDKNDNDFHVLLQIFLNSFSTKKSVFFLANFGYGHFSDLIHSYFEPYHPYSRVAAKLISNWVLGTIQLWSSNLSPVPMVQKPQNLHFRLPLV